MNEGKMNCTEFEKNFKAAINQKLPENLLKEWEKHLKECEFCQHFSEKVEYFRNRLQTLGFDSAPTFITKEKIIQFGNNKRKLFKRKLAIHTMSFAAGTVVGALIFLLFITNATVKDVEINKISSLVNNDTTIQTQPSEPQKFVPAEANKFVSTNKDTVDTFNTYQKVPKSFEGTLQIVSGQ